MRISDWSSDVCSSDLQRENRQDPRQVVVDRIEGRAAHANSSEDNRRRVSMVNGSVGPQASKKVTSCLRAPSSFHLRSRWMTRSEEHTSELQSLMRISYAVFCLKKKKQSKQQLT